MIEVEGGVIERSKSSRCLRFNGATSMIEVEAHARPVGGRRPVGFNGATSMIEVEG